MSDNILFLIDSALQHMMLILGKIFKTPKTFLWLHHAMKWKYSGCLVHHFMHISPRLNLTYLGSLAFPPQFKISSVDSNSVCLHSLSLYDLVSSKPVVSQPGGLDPQGIARFHLKSDADAWYRVKGNKHISIAQNLQSLFFWHLSIFLDSFASYGV